MKCVQNQATKEIRRVSEDRAIELTQKGWAFVSKEAWKKGEGTSWVKNTTPANPMSESKKHRISKKNARG